MSEGRCMARRQNGCHPLTTAIFVIMGLLLLYGPHITTAAEGVSCGVLNLTLAIPGGWCVTGPSLIYRDLPQDHSISEVYKLKAQEGITLTAFEPEGEPDANFNDYFTGSLADNAIVWEITASIQDLGDYSADGNNSNIKPAIASSNYRLKFTNDSVNQELVISKFEFKIVDINNKPPEFEDGKYTTSLREDWPLDLEIPELKVHVRDLDYDNGPVKLSFDDNCPLDPVGGAEVSIEAADYSEITFKLKAKLDHEANPNVTCTLTATDSVNEGSTQIVINVEAGQDKPPKFDNVFYWINVGNESPGDALPVRPAAINAVDQDLPPTDITYTLEDAQTDISGTTYFKIEESTAVITLIKELDEEFLNEHSQLRFVIYGTDEVGDQDKAFLEINLPAIPTTTSEPTSTDPLTTTEQQTTVSEPTPTTTTPSASTTHTPSGPEFRKDSYLFQKLKTMTEMGTVKATIDGQDSDQIDYTIQENDEFTIDLDTGDIKKKQTVLEANKMYNLTVSATANGISGYTLVHIQVYDDLDLSLSITKSLHQVSVQEEDPGVLIGAVKHLGAEAPLYCVIYQEGVDKYDDILFTFSNNNLMLKEDSALDREEVKELRVWVQIFNNSETDCAMHYGTPSKELDRSQSLFVIEVVDINDNSPRFDYPESSSITVAYPEDPALQKVVGPVMQLRASDSDDSDYVSYTLNGDDKFDVDTESGDVFWEGKDSLETSCGGDGCSFIVKAQDKDSKFSNPITCNVVSLPQDNIYTLSFSDMTLSDVDDKLKEISGDIGMTVKALYVTPKPSSLSTKRRSTYTKYLKKHSHIRDGLVGTPFNLDVHVSVLKGGGIVSLLDFNSALSAAKEENAADFSDKEVFKLEEVSPEDVLGYQIALGVTGGLMGIIVLVLVIMGIIRYRKRSSKRRGPEVPDLRRSYGNQGYSSDYVNDDIKPLNGTLGGASLQMNGFHEPPRDGRDSPPLNKSVLATSPDPTPYQGGLRRTAPENVPNLGQPASREPPAQFKDSTEQQQPKQRQTPPPATVAEAPYVTALANPTTADAKKSPAEPLLPQAGSSSYTNTSSSANQTRQKKDPPPQTATPKKSALKGTGGATPTAPQKTKDPPIPLSSMAPTEPTADYDSSPKKTANSAFSGLKASPPPKKKEVEQTKQDKDDKNEEEDISPDRKKSNLKAVTETETNDQDKKKEQKERKNSVAFKVLVEEKTIQAQNEGPAAKKQAENEAKAEANQAAVDIMEANKKKLKNDEDDEDDNSKL